MEKWTSVLKICSADIQNYRLRTLATDLIMVQNLPGASGAPLKHWQPIFFPKDFAKARQQLELDNYRLSQD